MLPDSVPSRATRILDLVGRQNGFALDQNKMQAEAEVGHAAGERQRVFGRRTGDHQIGGAEDAFAVRRLDGVIHLFGEAKVVGGDDQPIQRSAPRLSRRKAKNSTASRNRRFSISGLLAISETIAAIFGTRK